MDYKTGTKGLEIEGSTVLHISPLCPEVMRLCRKRNRPYNYQEYHPEVHNRCPECEQQKEVKFIFGLNFKQAAYASAAAILLILAVLYITGFYS